MMAVIDTCCSTLHRLATVAKDGLVAMNRATKATSVASGARLRSCPRRRAQKDSRRGVTAKDTFIGSSSGGGEQAVLAHDLAHELPCNGTAPHHDDSVGEREHGFRFG